MIELKVRQIGNSLGVVLPKEVLGRLRAKSDEAEGKRLMALGKELDPELGVISFDF